MDMATSNSVLLFTTAPAIPAHIGWRDRRIAMRRHANGDYSCATHGQAVVAGDIGSFSRDDTGEPAAYGI